MRFSRFNVLSATAVVSGVCLASVALYHSSIGLGLRAQLGQTSGIYLNALELYQGNDVAKALATISPLVETGHEPSLNLVCGFVNGYERVAPTEEECVTALQNRPSQRLESLTDIAMWAQEWDVAATLLDKRFAQGDLTSHFDRARLIFAAPSGHFAEEDLQKNLDLAQAAQDPRGQYAAVVSALNLSSGGTLSPVLTEILSRQPKMRAADAYFELAKLIQTGAVSSDLSYVEVLQRADATGNPDAARYLAQYYISNPDQDESGAERRVWLDKAAAANDPVAQYNLALTLMNNPDDPAPMANAVFLLDRAAATGFVPAMNMLGATLWQRPNLLPQTPEEVRAQALGLMEAAAGKDDLNALFNLGNIHLSQQDQPTAVEYLRRAAALGSEAARELLVQIGGTSD